MPFIPILLDDIHVVDEMSEDGEKNTHHVSSVTHFSLTHSPKLKKHHVSHHIRQTEAAGLHIFLIYLFFVVVAWKMTIKNAYQFSFEILININEPLQASEMMRS